MRFDGTLLAMLLVPGAIAAQTGRTAGGLAYSIPRGYAEQRQGDVIVLAPTAPDEATPCMYGFAPLRPAGASLEADAERALAENVVPGWRKLDGYRYAMRGTSAAGWPHAWHRASFQGQLGGAVQNVNAMALVLPAGNGRLHVVWGMGNLARCLLDDATFEQLFHSLRPAAWTSDDGAALTRVLAGAWRFTAGAAGMQQLRFGTDGRYDRDVGSRAQVGVGARTSATASSGRWSLADGQLTLVPDHRPQSPDRYRVRVYDEWYQDRWRRTMVLLDGSTPPNVIQYYPVER